MPLTESPRQHLAEQLEASTDRDAAVSMLSILPASGEELATKRDIDELRVATTRDIDDLRVELGAEISAVEQRLVVAMHQELVVQTRWMTGVCVGSGSR